jgi:hypothetical protein
MPILEELLDNIGALNIFIIMDFEAKLQPDCACCEGLQESDIPWK